MISDVVLEKPLPQKIRESVEAYVGCIGGASLRSEYLKIIEGAGFREIRVDGEARFGETLSADHPQVREAMSRLGITFEQAKGHLDGITSLHVFAVK